MVLYWTLLCRLIAGHIHHCVEIPVSILDHFALTKHILGEESAKDYFANASICK